MSTDTTPPTGPRCHNCHDSGWDAGQPNVSFPCPLCSGVDATPPDDKMTTDARKLAEAFHDTYEQLAPSFGYTTRTDTRKFDPESPNGKLMQAVVTAVVAPLTGKIEGLQEALRIVQNDRNDFRNGVKKMHVLLGLEYYSWQRVYQEIERLLDRAETAERALRASEAALTWLGAAVQEGAPDCGDDAATIARRTYRERDELRAEVNRLTKEVRILHDEVKRLESEMIDWENQNTAEVERLTKESDTRWNEVDAGYITMVQVLRGLCKSIRVSWERCAPQDVEAKLAEMEGYLEGKHPYSEWIKRDAKELADLRAQLAALEASERKARYEREDARQSLEYCREQLAATQADKERLDWLANGHYMVDFINDDVEPTVRGEWICTNGTNSQTSVCLRAAIDDARRKGGAK